MLCMNEHYQQTPEELYQKLDACPEGLSAETAAKHLEQYGKNAIAEAKKTPTWLIFLEQFKDFLVIILIIAALIHQGFALPVSDFLRQKLQFFHRKMQPLSEL